MNGETFGSALRRFRKLRDLTFRALASRAHLSHGYIQQLETGERQPSVKIAKQLDDALQADGALLSLAGGSTFDPFQPNPTTDALRVACEWLVTEPPQVEHLRSGRRVGAGLADKAETRLQELRRLDDRLGGTDTLTLVERELVDTATLVHEGSYTEVVGRRLLGTLAELHQLAGWTASDAGEHARAERFYLDGVRAARQAGAPSTAGNLLSCLAYQVANVAKPSDAVLIARTALHGASHAARGRVRALLLERVAWAHARAGENAATDRALGEVLEALAEPDDNEPDWVYWLDSTEVDIMAGRCYVELRRPLRAVPLLSDAIAGYPQDRMRETALYQTWLAESYLQANEQDAARDTLGSARKLAHGVNSKRLDARIRTLIATLT